MKNWADNISDLQSALAALTVTDGAGSALEPDKTFGLLKNITRKIKENGNTVFLIGNGASATMASHIATDLLKNCGVRAEVFTDLSLLTAVANDIRYEEVFAEPLRRKMLKGDLLAAISSSGQSPNILAAAREAPALGGAVVTLSGMRPQNTLRTLGALNFYVPAETYGLAETAHACILHHWVDMMMESSE